MIGCMGVLLEGFWVERSVGCVSSGKGWEGSGCLFRRKGSVCG